MQLLQKMGSALNLNRQLRSVLEVDLSNHLVNKTHLSMFISLPIIFIDQDFVKKF